MTKFKFVENADIKVDMGRINWSLQLTNYIEFIVKMCIECNLPG